MPSNLPLALCAALACCGTALAAAPPMSREALRQCEALQREIGQLRFSVQHEQLLLALAEQEFRSVDTLVKALRPALDLDETAEVEAFNLKVARQGQALDAYRARLNAFNPLADRLDAGIARFNSECTGEYLESDLRAVQAEHEAALKAQGDSLSPAPPAQ